MKDFIGIYEDAHSHEYCDALIAYHESMTVNGLVFNRDECTRLEKEDVAAFSSESYIYNAAIFDTFTGIFWRDIYSQYSKEISVLNNMGKHSIFAVKVQKTEIGGGYHIWHCESDTRATSVRVLNFILYLNDVEEGGETEFLYYHKRIKPQKGMLVLFPAGLTHTHRGNPPLSGGKYILTGWVEM